MKMYKLHVRFFPLHARVCALFVSSYMPIGGTKQHTHTFIHVHTPLSEKLAGKISQHLFIKRENEA